LSAKNAVQSISKLPNATKKRQRRAENKIAIDLVLLFGFPSWQRASKGGPQNH
jgi:hypothetical protein